MIIELTVDHLRQLVNGEMLEFEGEGYVGQAAPWVELSLSREAWDEMLGVLEDGGNLKYWVQQ